MSKKTQTKERPRGGRETDESRKGGPRKPVVFIYRRNFVLGIGMILFTFGWILVFSPVLRSGGMSTIFGYVLLAVVSIVNWSLVLQALRAVPWSTKQVELARREVTWTTVGGRDRTVMRSVRRLKWQKNPLFMFARGLVVYGESADGRAVRETVFFGDLGREGVEELERALRRYL